MNLHRIPSDQLRIDCRDITGGHQILLPTQNKMITEYYPLITCSFTHFKIISFPEWKIGERQGVKGRESRSDYT